MNIMLDLETLDTKPTAVVTSIGIAVDLGGGAMDTYDLRIDAEGWEEQLRMGRTVSASTLRWWLQQSEQARQALVASNTYLDAALDEVELVVSKYPGATWWANGAAFDFPVIRSLHASYKDEYGFRRPLWDFRDERCYRTLRSLLPHIQAPTFNGAAHRAIDDAVFQLEHLRLMLNPKLEVAA